MDSDVAKQRLLETEIPFFCGATAQSWTCAASLLRFLDYTHLDTHTHTHTQMVGLL